jgi:hypothetical protein
MLAVHDLHGRRIAVLADGERPAGRQFAMWSGRTDRGARAGAGIYFVRLTVDGGSGRSTREQRLVLVR